MRRRLVRRLAPRNFWGDRLYGRYMFRRRMGRWPEKEPVRFNDHLFRLKTSGALMDPLVQFVTDKEYAKLHVAATVGEAHVVQTYAVLRNREEARCFRPERFPCVVKPTHSSGQVAILRTPDDALDREALAAWFDLDRYLTTREPNYRYLQPKIIVEEFFSEDGETPPKDYKVFCFRGEPGFVQVDSSRFSGHRRNLYDTAWNRIRATLKYPAAEEDDARPRLLEDMLDLARRLSQPFPFVRVDFYASDSEIRVGELSFTPGGARERIDPPEVEFLLGAYFKGRPGA